MEFDAHHDSDGLACRQTIYWLERDYCFDFNFKSNSVEFIFDEAIPEHFKKSFSLKYNDFILRKKIEEKTLSIKQLIMAKMLFPSNVSIQENNSKDPIELSK